MSSGERRTRSWGAWGAAVCALAISLAPLRAVSAVVCSAAPSCAPSDTAAGAARETSATAMKDTIARIEADTSAAAKEKPTWNMEDLKRVLGEETGGTEKGKEYRERKSGRVAMACAVLVPGLGQMYNEKPLKAAIALGLESFYLSRIAMNRRLWEREKIIRDAYPAGSGSWREHDRWVAEYWERSVDWIWWSGAVVLGIVIDAYVDAKLDDMRFKVEARASGGDVGISLLVRY